MLVRSRSRNRARGGGSSLDNELLTLLSYGASDAWDFVVNQYIRGGVLAPSGITVTRASSGYAETSDGRLVEFGSGVARRTDKGLLVEGARTNLLTYSQAFNEISPGAWSVDNSGATDPVVTANYGNAPDGTMTADRIQFNKTGGTFSRIFQSLTALSSDVYTFSVYMKTLVGTANVGIRIQGTGINCAVTTTWQRFSVSLPSAGTSAISQIILFDSIPGNDETADVLVWGAQTEAGTFASSYIPTAASTVTRAADQVEASLSGVAYPASLYAEFVRNGDTGAAEGVLQVDAPSRAQRANINISSTDTLSATARGGANNGDAAVTGAITVGAITKGAGRIAVDDVQAARAGTLATADTTASVPTSSPDTVRFGDFSSAATYGFNYIRRAAIFPSALTDAQLQAITS